MKLNNKGFTLVEVLAVVVLLAVLMSITVPSIGNLLKIGKENNYNDLIDNIKSASVMYMSDNRYDIGVNGTCTLDNTSSITTLDVIIYDTSDTDKYSKLYISTLIEKDYISTDKNNNIINPKNNTEKLNLNNSYVEVKYSCTKKDYIYENINLEWK